MLKYVRATAFNAFFVDKVGVVEICFQCKIVVVDWYDCEFVHLNEIIDTTTCTHLTSHDMPEPGLNHPMPISIRLCHIMAYVQSCFARSAGYF